MRGLPFGCGPTSEGGYKMFLTKKQRFKKFLREILELVKIALMTWAITWLMLLVAVLFS